MSQAPLQLFAAQPHELGGFAESPEVPSRPNNKWIGRSSSPGQERFNNSSLTDSKSTDTEIHRPPSVNLPSVGQEGIEYADLYESIEGYDTQTSETIDIGNDQKLYGSELSSLNSSVEKYATTITPNESEADNEKADKRKNYSSCSQQHRSLLTPNSLSGISADLPQANIGNCNGIPHFGQFVPMNPNAGDVQAPPPHPTVDLAMGAISSGKQTLSSYHGQKISGRDQEIPTDAYGRYGHGILLPQDNFDKAYYKKHPELLEKEFGSYGGIKPNWVMSSEDLNKIVHDTKTYGTRVDASPEDFGTPSEQVGFQASEKYAIKISSSQLQTGNHNAHKDESKPQVVDLLSEEQSDKDDNSVSKSNDNCELSQASEIPESLDRTVIIHIDEPISCDPTNTSVDVEHGSSCNSSRKSNHNEDYPDDRAYKAPILASDEVVKKPFDRNSQFAKFQLSRMEDSSQETPLCTPRSPVIQTENKCINANIAPSISDSPPTLFNSLDDYGPLFPDEGDDPSQDQKSSKPREILKFSERSRKFPSQDVWEDTPNSLQYTATVSVPQLPEEKKSIVRLGSEIETLPQAFARRQEELAENELMNPSKQPRQEKFKRIPHVVNQPSEIGIIPKTMNHRFPSQDTWEDAPESLLLQTTVARPQIDEEAPSFAEENKVLVSAGTQGTCKPSESVMIIDKLGNKSGYQSSNTIIQTSTQFKKLESPGIRKANEVVAQERSPKVTLRSHSNESAPVITTKPKPQIPARPSKLTSRNSSGSLPSSNISSNIMSTGKPKPPVPPQSAGGRIAALQGSFMSDLNKRLQLGPHAPKKSISKNEQCQDISENAPLIDPRKNRARGPVRRAPNRSVMSNPPMNISEGNNLLKISAASTIWSLDPESEYL